MSVPMAFTIEQAAKVSGVSARMLKKWDADGVLAPSLSRVAPGAPNARVYSYDDLIKASVLSRLKQQFALTPQKLKTAADFLRLSGDLSALRLIRSLEGSVLLENEAGDRLGVSMASESPSSGHDRCDFSGIQREVEVRAGELTRRRAEEIGQITSSRVILGNRSVIAGTRIPTEAIWDFHVAGYDVGRIIAEYPRLTPLDVERAIAFEAQRRHLQQAS